MSEFRIFCFGGFLSAGLYAASLNHGIIEPQAEVLEALHLLVVAFVFGCAAVVLFGRRVQS